MSSRKRGHTDISCLNKLIKRVKYLEKKVIYRKRRRVIEESSSSLSSCSRSRSSSPGSPARSRAHSPENLEGGDNTGTVQVAVEDVPLPRSQSPSSNTANVVAESETLPSTSIPVNTEVLDENLIELDSSVLEILGDDPTAITTYGKNIQKDLAVRFEHITTQGLAKETRKELLEKYLIPSNCSLIDAPAINPEIRGAISLPVSKRIKAMEYKQKQLASAISGLGQVITQLINKKDNDPDMLKTLMDVGRLMCDCQHNDSVTRKNFILSTLRKDMKEQIESTKLDKFLFGTDLSETLKAAKAINKSSAELKPAPVKQQVKKPSNAASKNWKAPPTRRGTAPTAQRSQETMSSERRTRQQRASSSRSSQGASRHSRR